MNKALEFLRSRGASKGGPLPTSVLARIEREQREKTYERVAQSEELDEAMERLAKTNKAQVFLQGLLASREAAGTEPRPAYREVTRIANIPAHARHTDEERALFQHALVQAEAFDAGFRFTEAQIESALTFDRLGGLFGPIGVGHGKTYISILCAALAYERGKDKTLLFVPSQVYAQLMERDVPQARRLLTLFGVPFVWLGGEPMNRRRALCASGRRGCYVMPYSLLSARDASDMLDAIAPSLIVADEAHHLKNATSARTKRVRSYVEEHHPQFVALSGTITLKSVMDYWHLLLWCLGPGSCLPLTHNLAYEWAIVLDSETSNSAGEAADTGPLVPLIEWARRQPGCPPEVGHTVRGFRAAYRLRMATTPGVVQTGDEEIGTSLVIEQYTPLPRPDGEAGATLARLIDNVVTAWTTPNDDPIDYGLHKFKWLHELTAGFWHRLTWPEPAKLAARLRVSEAVAADMVERAKTHHEAQKLYHSELRKWLEANHIKGLDTPFLVAGHIARYGGTSRCEVSALLVALWQEMQALDFEGRPDREATPVRVSDYKVAHACRWAAEHQHGIVWYWHNAIGDWLVEEMREAGLDPVHCNAGAAGNKRILDSRGQLCVASIAAHNTGKNLQFHRNQLVVQWPRSAKDVEQMLGRLHRRGQEADELICHTNLAGDFDYMLLAASLTDSLYIHQSGGGRQKAVVAGWNPLPQLFPHSVLVERGLDPQGGALMEAAMKRHFKA